MYIWDTTVLYSQLGVQGTLSPAGLLHLFQDIAILHSHARGCGRDWVAAQGCAWILSRWRVGLGEMPRCDQPVRVTTQAYSCRHALCRRAFSLEDENGRRLALADSLWTLVDISTGAPTDASRVVAPMLTPGEPPQLEGLPKKVRLPESLTPAASFPVTTDLLDANRHVNNIRSAQLAMRPLPMEARLSAMAIDYHQALLPGQTVELDYAPFDGGIFSRLRSEGQLCLSAQFWTGGPGEAGDLLGSGCPAR